MITRPLPSQTRGHRATRVMLAWVGIAILSATILPKAAQSQAPKVALLTRAQHQVEAGQTLPSVLVRVTVAGQPDIGKLVVLEYDPPTDGTIRIHIGGGQATTDSSGIARFDSLTIGSSKLVTLRLTPKVDGSIPPGAPVLEINVRPRDPTRVQIVQHPPTGYLIGVPSETPLLVMVTDNDGHPYAGAAVLIRAKSPCAAPLGNSARTGPDGRAAFPNLRIGPRAGSCVLVAELPDSKGSGDTPSPMDAVEVAVAVGPAARVSFGQDRPAVIQAGEPVHLSVRVTDSIGTPKPDQQVLLRIDAGEGQPDGDKAPTNDQGVAEFSRFTVKGKPGTLTIAAIAGDAATPDSAKLIVPLAVGPPRRLLILTQPPAFAIPDSAFTRTPVLRVEDLAGNRLEKQEVRVSLCRLVGKDDSSRALKEDDPTAFQCDHDTAELTGTSHRRSNEDGIIRFDSLALTGHSGKYVLRFELVPGDGAEGIVSTQVRYDPDLLLDRNFVEVGAIKSVSGGRPASEFFALRFKFRLARRAPVLPGLKLFILAYTDIALSDRESTDSVNSSTDRLDEAGVSINFQAAPHANSFNDVPERSVFFGPAYQIFRTVPFIGMHAGSIEHAGSPFQGSTASLGVFWSLYATPVIVNGETLRTKGWSAFAHFYVRAATVAFFKHLSLRGTFRLPFTRGQTVESRIAIIVPIETLRNF